MNNVLYFTLIFLTTYTDSFLTPYFGAFGFSLLPIISYILFIIRFLVGNRKTVRHPFPFFFIKLVNYSFSLSFLLYIIFICLGMQTTYYGSDLIMKAIRLYMTFMSYVLFIYVLVDIMRCMKIEDVFKPFFYINIFLAIFGIVEYSRIPNAFLNLHYAMDDVYYRVRLLTQESSHTAPLIEVFFIMATYYALYIRKSRIHFVITLVCLCSQIYITSSKSFMVVLGVSLVFGLWETIKTSRYKGVMVVCSLGLLMLFYHFFYHGLVNSFQGDIDNSTSTATRLTSNLSGYLMGITIPCGVGFGGYLYFLPKFITFIMDQLPSILNKTELWSMLKSKDDKSIAAQSFFSQSSTYWGCIGVILFARYLFSLCSDFLKYVNPKHKALFKTVFCVIFLNLSISTGLDFVYLAVLSIAIHIINQKIYI